MRIIEETERIMAANAHWNAAGTPALRRLAEADKLLQLPANCEECYGTGYVKPSSLFKLVSSFSGGCAVTRVICLACGGSGKRP